jgi:hypothetical protein
VTDQVSAAPAALPAPAAGRDSVVTAMRAICAAVDRQSRAALEDTGGTWPAEVADARAAYWRRHGV